MAANFPKLKFCFCKTDSVHDSNCVDMTKSDLKNLLADLDTDLSE